MHKILVIILAVFVFSGWSWGRKKDGAIKIGDIRVTAKEFEDAYNSTFFLKDSSAKREEFLASFIARKLILMEAEKQGLDKASDFLNSLQLFWEQALLKLMISKRMNELAGTIRVAPDEVDKYYGEHKSDFGEKQSSEVHSQIKWLLFKEKQREALEEWIKSLKEKTPIEIDYESLGIERQ